MMKFVEALMTRQRLLTLDRQSSQAAGPGFSPNISSLKMTKREKFSSPQCFYSLGILLNFEELVKIENYSRNVAEEEDADDANQDHRKVHLFNKINPLLKEF